MDAFNYGDVIDPNLAAKLKTFGIDVMDQKKVGIQTSKIDFSDALTPSSLSLFSLSTNRV